MSVSSHAECKRRRAADLREATILRKRAGLTYSVDKIDPALVAARLAEIPQDTRSLTQRICGDPLPGRDALSRAKHS